MCPPADSRSVARAEPVRIWLLGGFRVSVGPRTIEQGQWRLKKVAYWCTHQRIVVHRLMRLAFEEEADYLMEALEVHREHVAAQLAYTLVDSERKWVSARA